VVNGVANEDHVDGRRREHGAFGKSEDGNDVFLSLGSRPFRDVAKHVRLEVDGKDRSRRSRKSETSREVARARADVGNAIRRPELESGDDLVRLLLLVALGALELRDPPVDVFERVSGSVLMLTGEEQRHDESGNHGRTSSPRNFHRGA
jgi:hypothetical protein